MIYDSEWVPQSDDEYQQRLLATIVLLVSAAGGTITLSRDGLLALTGTGSMLHQDRKPNGDLVLTVTQHTTGVPQ